MDGWIDGEDKWKDARDSGERLELMMVWQGSEVDLLIR